jgi:hypothetical protein
MNPSQVGVLNSDEAFCLGVSIVLTLLCTGLFFTDAPPIQQDSAILMLTHLALSVHWLMVLFFMTAFVAKTAIGRMDHRVCVALCGTYAASIPLLLSLVR